MMEQLVKNDPDQTGGENPHEASPESVGQAVDLPVVAMPSVGVILRTAREGMGMSIDDVVVKIKLAPRQIMALEADDFQVLPETAFLRGFVRSYAKLLQLDAQPLLDALPGAVVVNATQVKVEQPLPTEKTSRRQNINLLTAALLVTVLIAGFAVWQNSIPQQPVAAIDLATSDVASLPMPVQVEMLQVSEVTDVQASSSVDVPLVAPVSMVAPVSAVLAPKTISALRLVFDKESWAEIKDQSGKVLARQVNAPGSELRVEGVAPYTMVIGHASAVHLFYGEKPVDLSVYVKAGSDVARVTLE